MDNSRQKLFLALALIGLAAAVGYRLLNPYEQPRVKRLTYGPVTGTDRSTDTVETGALFPIRRDHREKGTDTAPENKESSADTDRFSDEIYQQFVHQPASNGAVAKDLFGMPARKSSREADKISSGPARKTTEKNGSASKPQHDPVAEVVRYLSSYTLMGGFEAEDQRAVFLSKGSQVLVARVGDRINGKYRIDAIEENKITIQALDINETIHLDTREFNHE